MPYGEPTDSYEEFTQYKNSIDKAKAIEHMESLPEWVSSSRTYDMFTGEEFQSGIIMDRDFTFPLDFLRYYKKCDIGIPYEYEEYLKKEIGIN